MALVKRGTSLTIVVSGSDESRRSFDPLTMRVVTICDRVTGAIHRGSYAVQVNSCDVRLPSIGFPDILWQVFSYPYTGTWKLTATADYAEPSHVASTLAGAIYDATGFYPAEIAVTRIGWQYTGSPEPADPAGPGFDLGAIVSNLGSFLEGLSGNLGWIVIGLLLIAALVIFTGPGQSALRIVT